MDWKPGEGSTRITALGPSSGWTPTISWVRASRRVSCFSSGTKQEAVKDVAHSRSTRISWRWRLITSAAKEIPTTSGESSEDWWTKEPGNDLREVQVWQADVTREMASFMSRAKNWRWRINWWRDGWLSLIWRAVRRPSRTERGTTMASATGVNGRVRLTTRSPSLAMETWDSA